MLIVGVNYFKSTSHRTGRWLNYQLLDENERIGVQGIRNV